MSVQLIDSELIEDISTEDQELLSGGQLVRLPIRLRGNARTISGRRVPVKATVRRARQLDGLGQGGFLGLGGLGQRGFDLGEFSLGESDEEDSD